MKEALVDISVLMIFFNRPYTLKEVFAAVKEARPARLFLYQDGPRNENDLADIEECRKVVEDIDWDCEVHKLYQEKNFGCDPSGYLAQTWAFSLTDKCIVLEDDCVPDVSFFTFCKELLDKYENDERIWMIAGFNHLEEVNEIKEDYFFTSIFSIWGWASWRRVIEKWDGEYNFYKDTATRDVLLKYIRERKIWSHLPKMIERHIKTGKQYHETVSWSGMILNSGLAIMPKCNMVSNIGVTSDSTHFTGSVMLLPRGIRKIFTMKRHELKNPLKHPAHVIENVDFKDKVYKVLAWDHPLIKISRSFEELYLNLRYCYYKNILNSFRNRVKKIFRIK